MKKKKAVSMVLTLVLCLGLAVPVMAEETDAWSPIVLKASGGSVEVAGSVDVVERDSFVYVAYEDSVNIIYAVPEGSTFQLTNDGGAYPLYVYCKTYELGEGTIDAVRDPETESEYKLDVTGKYVNYGSVYNLSTYDGGIDAGNGLYWNEDLYVYSDFLIENGESVSFALPASGKDTLNVLYVEYYNSAEDYYYLGYYNIFVDDGLVVENTVPVEEGNPFTDVPMDAYYHDAVLWAYENGIAAGTTETTFSPQDTCTRGQVVSFLWRAAGCPEPTSSVNPFTDVKESDYFYDAVLWAYENGIVAGMTETTYGPAVTCTSAHVVTFLWRANGKPAGETTGTEYYAEAVAWADAEHLLDGTDTPFAPGNNSPRADIVTYLYRDMA